MFKSNPRKSINRVPADAYYTPQRTVDLILEHIDFSKVGSFCEPCRGSGVILDSIPDHIPKFWCEIQDGRDYLGSGFTWKVDLIVTNPPYSLALEFLRKSLKEAKTVIYLLPFTFLGSRRRNRFFNENKLSHLYILSERPSFTGTTSDMTEYVWAVWDRASIMKDSPGIYFLGNPLETSIIESELFS